MRYCCCFWLLGLTTTTTATIATRKRNMIAIFSRKPRQNNSESIIFIRRTWHPALFGTFYGIERKFMTAKYLWMILFCPLLGPAGGGKLSLCERSRFFLDGGAAGGLWDASFLDLFCTCRPWTYLPSPSRRRRKTDGLINRCGVMDTFFLLPLLLLHNRTISALW